MSQSSLPLSGVRVVDLSRVLAGPLCGALLGDMGAEVIKIEDVANGDESRHWAPQKDGHSPVYIANNRNKKSIAVNLKAPEGAKIVTALVKQADVLIENFGTGTMDRLGLDYSTLSALNPGLIYCSIAAFGRRGPRAQEPGYEALMQAFSGVMAITGESGRPPVRCGISALDIYTGTISGFAIVNAILMRQTSGVGQRIDASLFDSAISVLNFQAQNYLLCGVEPKPMGTAHPSLMPYQSFRCQDDRWVFIAAGNDRLWRRLTEVLGQPELASDKRFLTNIDRVRNRLQLEEIISMCLLHMRVEDVVASCKTLGVPATSVNSVAEALRDPQVEFSSAIRRTEHPELGEINVVGMPVAFSAIADIPNEPAPAHGAHTAEIMSRLGVTGTELNDLCSRGVLFRPEPVTGYSN